MSSNPENPSRHSPGRTLALVAIGGVLLGILGSQYLMRLATVPTPTTSPTEATAKPAESWIDPEAPAPPSSPSPPSEAPPRTSRQVNRITSVNVEVIPSRPAPEDEGACLEVRTASSEHRDPRGHPLPPLARARIGSGAFAIHGQVDQLAYLPDGEHLLARTFDGRLALFRVHDGAQLWVAGGLESGSRFALVPSRGALAVPACGGLVLLEATSGKELERWPMPDIQRSFAVTPDGAAVLGLRKSQRDHTRTLLTRWSVPNGAVTWSRPVGRSYGPLALSDDGARVAILTKTPGGDGGAWVVADATTGAELRRYDTTGNIEFDLAADFVPGTHTLVTSRREGATEAFPGDGGEPRTLPLAGEQTWRGGLSVDGALGVNRGGVVFTLDQGEEVARLGDVAEDRNLFSNLRAVAFSPDGTELAVVGRSIVRFHLRPGRQLLPEEDRAASVHGVFLASGDLVVQGPDQRLERWAPPYREGTSFGPPLRVRTPMGRGQRPGTVTAWSRSAWIRAASGKQASTTLARPPGGSYQWLLARHAEVLIQPPTEGSEHFLVMDAGDDEPRRVAVEGSFRHAATSELSDDGRYLVSVGATDLYLWDTGTGELLHHMPQAFAGGLVPGSQDLFWYRPASHIQGGGRSSGGPRQLWRVGAEAPLREFPGSGELAYVPGYDRLVGIVDVQGGLQFQPLSGDTTYETEDLELRHVRQVVVSDDGAALVTIHQDGTAYIWDTVNLLRNAGDPSTSR